MEILVTYVVTKEVEIPKEKVEEILNIESIHTQGTKFNTYVRDNYSDVAFAFDKVFDDAEIQGVYRPVELLNINASEVIWEV